MKTEMGGLDPLYPDEQENDKLSRNEGVLGREIVDTNVLNVIRKLRSEDTDLDKKLEEPKFYDILESALTKKANDLREMNPDGDFGGLSLEDLLEDEAKQNFSKL